MYVRAVTAGDVESALALLQPRPYAHCYLTALLEHGSVGDLIGIYNDAGMRVVASVSGNCVVSDLDLESANVMADHLAQAGRRVASIVARSADVELLWDALSGRWGSPRAVRFEQPLMVLRQPPAVDPDPQVRASTARDFAHVLPACIDMFTAEVGVSPVANGMEGAYRRRIERTIAERRSFIRTDDHGVLFKAEIGAVSSAACQVQGVWVRPDHRGTGLAAAGMAAVASLAMQHFAPAVELYVNDFNTAALRTYERVGFEQVDTFRTVFF